VKEHRELGHWLVVEVFEDGERDYEIEHPAGCPMIDRGEYLDYDCMTAAWLNDAGMDIIEGRDELPAGRYPIESWYVPQHWAGADPVDAEGGIELVDEA
jgi:hypothetical protein